jgi:hypothetical protein
VINAMKRFNKRINGRGSRCEIENSGVCRFSFDEMQKNLKLLNERLCQKIQEFHDRRQADLTRCVARLHTEIQSIDKFIGDSKHLLIDVNVQVEYTHPFHHQFNEWVSDCSLSPYNGGYSIRGKFFQTEVLLRLKQQFQEPRKRLPILCEYQSLLRRSNSD